MSDEFGTVNVRAGDRAREIDALRQHYRRHREALGRMIADAPSEVLAATYRRVAGEIDAALLKIDDVEGRAVDTQPAPGMAQRGPDRTQPQGDPLRNAGEPSMRPITHSPAVDTIPDEAYSREETGGGGSRVLMILLSAVVALVVIGWLVWRASSDGRDDAPAVPTPAVNATETIAPVPEPVAPLSAFEVSPPSQDYGIIRKGTRATRQYEVTNRSEEPLTMQLARSACRCLYYEYRGLIPPKGKESVTVTVDGAKAPAGALRESIAVTAKSDPTIKTTLEVVATVK